MKEISTFWYVEMKNSLFSIDAILGISVWGVIKGSYMSFSITSWGLDRKWNLPSLVACTYDLDEQTAWQENVRDT